MLFAAEHFVFVPWKTGTSARWLWEDAFYAGYLAVAILNVGLSFRLTPGASR